MLSYPRFIRFCHLGIERIISYALCIEIINNMRQIKDFKTLTIRLSECFLNLGDKKNPKINGIQGGRVPISKNYRKDRLEKKFGKKFYKRCNWKVLIIKASYAKNNIVLTFRKKFG